MAILEFQSLIEAEAVLEPKQIRQVEDIFVVATGSDIQLDSIQEVQSSDLSRILTDSEILAAVQAARTNDEVAVVLFKLTSRSELNSASPEFKAAKSVLVSAGILTQARADIIFGG